MLLTRLAVGLEPLNALDAAHASARSAPLSRAEFGSPVGPATRRPIKRNKELEKFLRGWGAVNGNREPLLDLVSACPPAPNACAAPIPQLTFASGNGVCLSSAEEEPHLS